MSYKAFSSTKFLDATITAMTHPLTVCIWVKKSATEWAASSDDIAGHLSDNFTDDNEAIEIYTRADTFRASWKQGASAQISSEHVFTDGDYDDVWVPLIVKYTSATSYIVYIENTSNAGALKTTSRNLTGLDSFRLGEYMSLSVPFEGKLGEVTVWDVALSDANINLINPTAGTGPAGNTIASANCVGYWPLVVDQSTHVDESGTANGSFVLTGAPTFDSDHPVITSSGNPWYHYAQQ
jgi:hypothetical protein